MNEEFVFYEFQRRKMSSTLLLSILSGCIFVILYFVYVIFQYLVFEKFREDSLMTEVLSAFVTAFCAEFFLCLFSRMKTTVNKEGIFVKYYPVFPSRLQSFHWETIEKVDVRTVKPFREWKIRDYSLSEKYGLQIVFLNGKKLFVGTQKPEELSEFLKKIGKIK